MLEGKIKNIDIWVFTLMVNVAKVNKKTRGEKKFNWELQKGAIIKFKWSSIFYYNLIILINIIILIFNQLIGWGLNCWSKIPRGLLTVSVILSSTFNKTLLPICTGICSKDRLMEACSIGLTILGNFMCPNSTIRLCFQMLRVSLTRCLWLLSSLWIFRLDVHGYSLTFLYID